MANARQGQFLGLFRLGAQRNTLRAIAGSPRPAASGVQSYLGLHLFADRAVSPAPAETARLRSCLRRPDRTFGLYLAQLMKASILLCHSTDWMSPEIRSTARGLANSQDVNFRHRNYLSASDFTRLIRRVEFSDPMEMESFFGSPTPSPSSVGRSIDPARG